MIYMFKAILYCLLICLKTLETNVWKFMSLILLILCLHQTGVKLELPTDPDMLLMVEKGIKGGKCDVIHRYVKAYNKK